MFKLVKVAENYLSCPQCEFFYKLEEGFAFGVNHYTYCTRCQIILLIGCKVGKKETITEYHPKIFTLTHLGKEENYTFNPKISEDTFKKIINQKIHICYQLKCWCDYCYFRSIQNDTSYRDRSGSSAQESNGSIYTKSRGISHSKSITAGICPFDHLHNDSDYGNDDEEYNWVSDGKKYLKKLKFFKDFDEELYFCIKCGITFQLGCKDEKESKWHPKFMILWNKEYRTNHFEKSFMSPDLFTGLHDINKLDELLERGTVEITFNCKCCEFIT